MKKIAFTMGDPAGIGPEVLLRALSSPDLERFVPVVIGDLTVIHDAVRAFGLDLPVKPIRTEEELPEVPDGLSCIDLGLLSSFAKGKADARNGMASVAYIRKAVDLAMAGKVDAVVTAPISKEALALSGFPWPGHTEMLAELTGAGEYAMMLAGGPLRVILVTIHTALRNVPGLITKEAVVKTIRLAKRACDMMGVTEPRIAVAGLNPHAGEAGIFGEEEVEAIRPAVGEARQSGIEAEGPYPPDIVFHKAYKGEVDIVVCMYHDQGLIPLKMIAFEKGVNVTVGLPIIRTSPDHGTAYDIAWKGIADPSSMIEAIKMALKLKL